LFAFPAATPKTPLFACGKLNFALLDAALGLFLHCFFNTLPPAAPQKLCHFLRLATMGWAFKTQNQCNGRGSL
jgi:hypothetical protein